VSISQVQQVNQLSYWISRLIVPMLLDYQLTLVALINDSQTIHTINNTVVVMQSSDRHQEEGKSEYHIKMDELCETK
jgi:hypothetical protein